MSEDRQWKKILSWALYDWANSAFATTVMAGFFPVFFKEYWSAGTSVTVSTFQLGVANSGAGLIVAFLAPLLGAIADCGNTKKRFLFSFALLGILTTASLYLVAGGDWKTAALCYTLGTVGFSGANIFYDSLIVNVAPVRKLDFVSSLGFSLGYFGGGLLFAVNVLMTLFPAFFGLEDAAGAVRISFLSVALWWAIFSIPLLLWVDEPRGAAKDGLWPSVRGGVRQLVSTLRQIRKLREVFLFLVAYWLYIDGVDTIIRMAVDYGLSLGFSSRTLLTALLITQFVGFPAALLFGWLGEKVGAKTGIFVGIGVYFGATLWAYFMDRQVEFYALAGVIGLVQGGVQSLSRSLYAGIIPPGKAAEFFGFYNMLGKSAAVIGPALMGWMSLLTGNPRISIFSVALLFFSGAVVLHFVNDGSRKATESVN